MSLHISITNLPTKIYKQKSLHYPRLNCPRTTLKILAKDPMYCFCHVTILRMWRNRPMLCYVQVSSFSFSFVLCSFVSKCPVYENLKWIRCLIAGGCCFEILFFINWHILFFSMRIFSGLRTGSQKLVQTIFLCKHFKNTKFIIKHSVLIKFTIFHLFISVSYTHLTLPTIYSV